MENFNKLIKTVVVTSIDFVKNFDTVSWNFSFPFLTFGDNLIFL